MAIHCPACGHSMTIKDPKPGRDKPKCGKCGVPFSITVSADAKQPPLVEKLSDPQATLPPAQQTVVQRPLSEVDDRDVRWATYAWAGIHFEYARPLLEARAAAPGAMPWYREALDHRATGSRPE